MGRVTARLRRRWSGGQKKISDVASVTFENCFQWIIRVRSGRRGVERKGEVKCGHVRRRRSSLLPNDKLRNKARRTQAGRQERHEETTETVRKTECNNSAATFPEFFHATRAGPWRSRCPPRPLPPNFPLKAKQPTSCRIF